MLYLALPGIMEMWPILVVLLLLFGAKKLPELARAMGSSINMFKKGLSEEESKAGELEGKSPEKLDEGGSGSSATDSSSTREREESTSK